MIVIVYLIISLQLLFAQHIHSFIKSPFQNKCRNINDNNNLSLNKIKHFIKNFCNHKNNKEIRKPAILEIPVELEEKWEEGEVPWDFVDNITKIIKFPNNIDGHQIAFLFI